MEAVAQINNLTFIWSIISTLISFLLALVSVGLIVKAFLDAQNQKRQVKIWMQYANGLNQALNNVISDNLYKRYTSTNDIANAIFSLSPLAFGLYQSLYEERCVTEKEFISQQKRLRDWLEKINVKKREVELKNTSRSSSNEFATPQPIRPPEPMKPPTTASLSPSPSPSEAPSDDEE